MKGTRFRHKVRDPPVTTYSVCFKSRWSSPVYYYLLLLPILQSINTLFVILTRTHTSYSSSPCQIFPIWPTTETPPLLTGLRTYPPLHSTHSWSFSGVTPTFSQTRTTPYSMSLPRTSSCLWSTPRPSKRTAKEVPGLINHLSQMVYKGNRTTER